MALPIYPIRLFNPLVVKAGLVGRVISSPPSLNGTTQSVQTDGGGRWQITYGAMRIRGPHALRVYEAWDDYLSAGSAECLVPMVSIATANRPWGNEGPRPVPDFGDKGSIDPYFPETASYQTPYIIADVDGNPVLGATQISIRVLKGGDLKGGEKFSIGEHGYRIQRVLGKSGNFFNCRISPRMRAAATSGQPVNLEWPYVKCTLAAGQDTTLSISRSRAEQTLTFVESV